MMGLVRSMRRFVINMQIRSLDHQAESIVHARSQALDHLMHIRRERNLKEIELWLTDDIRSASKTPRLAA